MTCSRPLEINNESMEEMSRGRALHEVLYVLLQNDLVPELRRRITLNSQAGSCFGPTLGEIRRDLHLCAEITSGFSQARKRVKGERGPLIKVSRETPFGSYRDVIRHLLIPGFTANRVNLWTPEEEEKMERDDFLIAAGRLLALLNKRALLPRTKTAFRELNVEFKLSKILHSPRLVAALEEDFRNAQKIGIAQLSDEVNVDAIFEWLKNEAVKQQEEISKENTAN